MRVLMTIVSVSTQATGTYCEESLSPAFAHIWVCPLYLVLFKRASQLTLGTAGPRHRVCLRHNRHVLPDPVLRPNQQGYRRVPPLRKDSIH